MSASLDFATTSVDETRRLGAATATLLVPGDVVSLTGDLGAGKTALVQGAAAGLGVAEPVTSPTFVLVREYQGPVPVYHLDIYRLTRLQEVLDLGFEDLLDPAGVIFIEWGDAIDALLPDSFLEIAITVQPDDSRAIRITGHGPAWAPRWERLEDVLGTWMAA